MSILNIVIICIIILILLKLYSVSYIKGLTVSIFFLILCPNNITIDFSISLPSFTIHRIILITVFLIWLNNKGIKKVIMDTPLIGILILITLSFGISTLFSDNLLVSIKRYFYFLLESLLYYMVLYSSLKNKDDMRNILNTILLSLSIVAILGIIQRYTGFNPQSLFGVKQTYELEVIRSFSEKDIVSTYPHRILFGAAMAIGAMIALFSSKDGKDYIEKIIYFLSTIFTLTALYFSFSRGPWLAFLISCAFIIFLFGYKPMMKRISLILIAALIIVVLRPGILETVSELYSSTLQPHTMKGTSYEWRFYVLNRAIDEVNKSVYHFFFGYGGGSHLFLKFEPVLLPTGHYGDFTSWDNEFAVILFEQGYIGLTLTLFFYIKFFVSSILHYIKEKEHRHTILLLISCVLIIAFMKTNVKIFAPQLVYLEFTLIAFGALIYSKKLEENICIGSA